MTELRTSNDSQNTVKSFSSFDDVKKDLNNLKSDVAGIAGDIKKAGVDRAADAASYVSKNLDGLKSTGSDALVRIEEQVKARPGQSIAIAFIAGALTSLLLGRKS
jgi:ElaB/YqjD/DUF883 family membrane-anchored ribosome-binding protein